MNDSFSPPTRFPPAAMGMLRNLCLRIAGLEQHASEACTQNVRQANFAAHPATQRFLDELEFLHASHTRALRLHATALTDECSLISTGGTLYAVAYAGTGLRASLHRSPFIESSPGHHSQDHGL
jgi:hypothetical protein